MSRAGLPDPEEAGITVTERVERVGMHLNATLHPDYTDRELRMLAHLGSLVSWSQSVLPVLERAGHDYILMPEFLDRVAKEHGPWMTD